MSKKSIHTKEYQLLISLLRSKRESLGLTQVNLAGLLGLDQTHISKIENYERRLDILELRAICRAFKISFIDFLVEFESKIND